MTYWHYEKIIAYYEKHIYQLGIGVDDMFILLSGLADTSSKDSVEDRIGKTMRTSGISVTITSVTDVIAFCAGAASVFPSVRNFSWYTGMYKISKI